MRPEFTASVTCVNSASSDSQLNDLKNPHGLSLWLVRAERILMNERDFFNEVQEMKRASYSCPHCRERADYEVRWLKRTKKRDLPRGAGEQDRMRFQKSRDYLVRVDDMLMCKNMRCRKRFDIPSSQSVVFI